MLHLPVSDIGPDDVPAEQLALPDSERVTAKTRHGPILGGRVKNGVQVFLNVPYGLDGGRFADPRPLPEDFVYEEADYITDRFYAPPPDVYPPESDRKSSVGLGRPTESPFFANIYVPSSYRLGVDPARLPVKVFIHGGFLQGGSPSGSSTSQQFFAAEQWSEIRVLLGYRLGVLGFLASSSPKLDGNWGFKDAWLGLEWIQRNIQAFGGDPGNVHLSGHSAGAHLVHNLLHHAARLAPIQVSLDLECLTSVQAPFRTATLLSNALYEDPFTLEDHQPQFEALCRRCAIDPTGANILDQLRDRKRLPMETLFQHVRDLGLQSSFVPASGGWLFNDMMGYQQRGDMARELLKAGVKCIIVGDARDELEGYKNAHEVYSESDILHNLYRWNRPQNVDKMFKTWPALPATASQEQFQLRLGDCLAQNRVHLPVRLLAQDFIKGGMPVIRYTVEMVAQNLETNGLVPHGSDLALHFLRLSVITKREMQVALAFHDELQRCIDEALSGRGAYRQRELRSVLALESDGAIRWRDDWRWERVAELSRIVRDGTAA
ncbi:Alpha/Beta hydrolase protein [Kockovaella imperatae]|uniref:Carboxylic ester hydrolase n=1 Tax=Kockovaella imperatae TaxID=4999 RepID=A0A1Y1UND5_9TREE|nr:Alpha/Beta hydrolase protein [Kockovaella imperatae]ORX39561.1 Alpha/Beta hydrolase protein [Kockovaella imperatae]